jgi:WG containing repeat
MTWTSEHSLCESCAGKLALSIVLGAILILFGGGCGHSTSETAADEASGPLFPVPINGATGFINDRGKVVVPARYESALPFSEGLAAVRHEGRWGYIDRSGKEVIPYLFRTAESFHGGVAIVNTGLPEHPVGLIDPSGAWVIQPIFRFIAAADGPNRLLLAQKEPAEGLTFYDRSGNRFLGPYRQAFPFFQDRARVKNDADEWIIDQTGNFIAKKQVSLDGTHYSDGMIAVRGNGKLGYMDLDGRIAIEPRYDAGGAFGEGLAPVQLNGRWLFIDKSGLTVAKLPEEITFAEPLSDGLSLVTAETGQATRKFGYVDKEGKWAVKPTWDEAQPFRDGLAYVGIWKGEIAVYINHKGRRVWQGRSAPQ